jgi:hypothetical protein
LITQNLQTGQILSHYAWTYGAYESALRYATGLVDRKIKNLLKTQAPPVPSNQTDKPLYLMCKDGIVICSCNLFSQYSLLGPVFQTPRFALGEENLCEWTFPGSWSSALKLIKHMEDPSQPIPFEDTEELTTIHNFSDFSLIPIVREYTRWLVTAQPLAETCSQLPGQIEDPAEYLNTLSKMATLYQRHIQPVLFDLHSL